MRHYAYNMYAEGEDRKENDDNWVNETRFTVIDRDENGGDGAIELLAACDTSLSLFHDDYKCKVQDKENPETSSYWHNNTKWLVEEYNEDGIKGVRIKARSDPSLYLKHENYELGLAKSGDIHTFLDSVWTVERTG